MQSSLLPFNRRLRRTGAALGTLLLAACAAEAPQPMPAPKGPPPVMPVPPSAPPSSAAPPPKIYSGSYAERLEAVARDTLTSTPVRVLRNGNTVKLVIPASAAFTANSAQLQTRFAAVLDAIARLGRDYDKTAISVKAFTDSTGSFEHNQTLSEHRAQSIGAYLARGITPARIHTAGYGPRYPIADNKTDSGRMQNRRVEIEMAATP